MISFAGMIRRGSHWHLAFVFSAFLPLGAIGVYASDISAEFGVTSSSIGLLAACFFLGGSISSFLAARVPIDALRSRFTLPSAGLAILMVGASLVPDFGWLIFGVLCMGVLNGAMHFVGNLNLFDVGGGDVGKAFGLKQAVILMAPAFVGILAPVIGRFGGWRAAFVVTALLVASIGFAVRLRSPSNEGRGGAVRALRAPKASRAMRPILVGSLLAMLGVAALPVFTPVFIGEVGFSPESSGLLFGILSAVGATMRVVFGAILDEREMRGAFRLIFCLQVAGCGGMIFVALAPDPVALLGLPVAFGVGWAWVGLLEAAALSSGKGSPASILSNLQAGFMLGSSLGPLGFGYLVDLGGFVSAWLTAGLVLFIGGGILFRQFS